MKHETDRLRAEGARSQDQLDQKKLESRTDKAFYARLGLDGPESATPAETFLISVYCERWTQEDLESGRFSRGEAEIERQAVDVEDLQRIAQDYGLDSPSASDPRHTPYLWFSSTTPREDHEHFEQGVHKYYSLHIHEAGGYRPQPADYQRIADLIGVRFDHHLQHQVPTHEPEGPDLCL
ncbi:hypothetical protein CDEF62S_00532 [Castellaniella defragrans]